MASGGSIGKQDWTNEEDNIGKQKMLNAKWIDRGGGDDVAVSPAAKCVCLLSNPACVSGVKNKGMRSKREAKADYATFTMGNVPPLPDYKMILPKGNFNGLCAHYNIRTDPDLGIDYAAWCCVSYRLQL